MASLSKLEFFFPLAILSIIHVEIHSKHYKCTVKIVFKDFPVSFF